MKVKVSQIPQEGLVLEEELSAAALEIEAAGVKFLNPLKVKAVISKITNVVTVDLIIKATSVTACSRCLEEVKSEINQQLKLNFPVSSAEEVIDLNEDAREEIMLDYALKPLCRVDCKGLCPGCGRNLNQGGCCCAGT